jgi:hypothetical protein
LRKIKKKTLSPVHVLGGKGMLQIYIHCAIFFVFSARLFISSKNRFFLTLNFQGIFHFLQDSFLAIVFLDSGFLLLEFKIRNKKIVESCLVCLVL